MNLKEPTPADLLKAEAAYVVFLRYLGIWDTMEEEPRQRTPARVVQSYLEFFGNNLKPINFTTFPCKSRQLVVVKDITFAALCAHHHLPFVGKCHVGYYPRKVVAGLSKIPRVVEFFTHGALIQEDVTERIAVYLSTALRARGVIVVMEAEHTCMALRGVRKPGHTAMTLVTRGIFDKSELIDRFLAMIGRRKN